MKQKSSCSLFFVYLLMAVIPLPTTIAHQTHVAENLNKTGSDHTPTLMHLPSETFDIQTVSSQLEQTYRADQNLAGKAIRSDCWEELPAKMELQLSDPSTLKTETKLSLAVNPEADAENVCIRLLLPDGVSLSRGSLQWKGNLFKNLRVQMNIFIKAETVGTFRIEAVAESNPSNGCPKTRSTQLYVEFSEREASVLGFAPECFAEIGSSKMSHCVDSNSVTLLSGAITVYGYWYYVNENGISMPTRFAKVELWNYNDSGDVLLATTFVQSNGYYEFPAIDNNGSLNVYVKLLCHSHQYEIVRVLNSDYVIFWSQTSINYNVTNGYLDMGNWTVEGEQKECWTIYDDVVDGYFWLLNKTGWSRSEVYARVVESGGSLSLGDGMDIDLLGVRAWDRDTVLHEYGHCIHYAARGGSFPYSPREDPEHYPDTESDGGWAFREGWAEFFPCAVDNTTALIGGGWGTIETTVYADGPFGHGDSGDWDGGVVEGAVAQVFWDIYDGINPNDRPHWDEIAYGDYVPSQFDKLWDIFLNDDPNNMNSFWLLWDSRDANLWAIFRHARIYKPRNIVVTDTLHPQESVTLGETAAINVTVRNLNSIKETFTLTVSANDYPIASLENIPLEYYESRTYTVSWNTTGFVRGDYTISAHVEVFPKDLDEADNTLVGSVVTLVSPGHDICVASVAMSRTINGPGFSWLIEIEVRNFGSFAEIFDVAATANSTEIGLFSNVSLISGGSAEFATVWNTTSFPKGNYTVMIYASPVPGETGTSDNTIINWIFVTILGDVDGDFSVDIIDVVKITGIYSSRLGDLEFSQNSDIDCDGVITILDVVICTSHYGDKWP